MTDDSLIFNPPPGWPKPPEGWVPPKGWTPDPSWPDPPAGWQLWISRGADDTPVPNSEKPGQDDQASQGVTDEAVAESSGSDQSDVRLARLEAENAALRAQLESIMSGEDIVVLDDEKVLQEAGIYRYHHPLENAETYRERLRELNSRVADIVKAKRAIEMSTMFTYDNSLAKGRRMTSDLSKLMLRAYNAEVDNSLRSLRAGNVATAKKRVEASRTAIKKLGKMMQMHISEEFHAMRLEEIEFTSDYLIKKQEEKEAAREERAKLREERRVEAELAAEREKLDKERSHILHAIESLKKSGATDPELEDRLAELDESISQNDFRAANIRAGYVYVISNRGAFGDDVVKIGLTRRLEPVDRVNELSGASVPFRFDVHCLFFSEDAVTLESELHQHFSDRRLNHANARKEFFFAKPAEVRSVLAEKVGNLLEFVETADSTEYLQSIKYWPDGRRSRS